MFFVFLKCTGNFHLMFLSSFYTSSFIGFITNNIKQVKFHGFEHVYIFFLIFQFDILDISIIIAVIFRLQNYTQKICKVK